MATPSPWGRNVMFLTVVVGRGRKGERKNVLPSSGGGGREGAWGINNSWPRRAWRRIRRRRNSVMFFQPFMTGPNRWELENANDFMDLVNWSEAFTPRRPAADRKLVFIFNVLTGIGEKHHKRLVPFCTCIFFKNWKQNVFCFQNVFTITYRFW